MRWKVSFVALALFAGVLAVVGPTTAQAADHDRQPVAVDISPQIDEAADDDTRISVQAWTVLAAGGAAALGLVAYMLRVIMGWVKPPPPPQEEAH